MTELREFALAAAAMRVLNGPAAEPIARLLDAHATDRATRTGQPMTELDTAALDVAHAVIGGPAAPITDTHTPEPR